jgi:acyl-CoA thioesterase FadM
MHGEHSMPLSNIYTKTIIISPTAIDENGHVNNVAYVQWMQDIAVEHYTAIGGIEAQGPDAHGGARAQGRIPTSRFCR